MLEAHPLGTIARLWRYPTKSLAARPLERATCDPGGIVGDRARALFVASPDHARVGKTYRGKENERLHVLADDDAAIALAAERGVALELRDDGPFFDLEPISLLFDTWLRDGERRIGRALDPLRFRPNAFVHAAADFVLDEDDLVDCILAIGDVRLRVTQPIHRCVTTTYDIETSACDPRVLATLARERENTMGVYAIVARPGEIAVGDSMTIARR